jgi:hypothetical protein
MKLAFNLTLQGKPVGPQDATTPCPLGGRARVHGNATSNAEQGATEVSLTYEFSACAYSQTDDDPKQTYSVTVNGSITESGTIAVQPSATTALIFTSDGTSITGKVYSPAIDYHADACPMRLGQNGNDLTGTLCERAIGLTL